MKNREFTAGRKLIANKKKIKDISIDKVSKYDNTNKAKTKNKGLNGRFGHRIARLIQETFF